MKFLILTAVSVCAALAGASPAASWSNPGAAGQVRNQVLPGEPVYWADGRTLSLGGASVASAGGAGAVFYNPAMLSGPRGMVAAMGADYLSEAVMDEREYSSSSVYRGPAAAIMIPAGFMNIGAGFRSDYDMSYSYRYKIYSAGNPDTFKKDISGGMNRMILGGGGACGGRVGYRRLA